MTRAVRQDATVYRDGQVASRSGSDAEPRVPLVPAVARAATVLDSIAARGGTPLGPSELARELSLPKSSISVICIELAEAGLVRRVASGYLLGYHVAELGATYLAGIDEVAAFHETCAEVIPNLEATAQLATLNAGLSVTYLARKDGSAPVRLMSVSGGHLPATCTGTGKALLAALPLEELERRLDGAGPLPQLTPNSIVDRTLLGEELVRTRERGWAIDDEETAEGVYCIAASIPNSSGSQRYAISFTMLRAQASSERLERLVPKLLELAEALASRLALRPLPLRA